MILKKRYVITLITLLSVLLNSQADQLNIGYDGKGYTGIAESVWGVNATVFAGIKQPDDKLILAGIAESYPQKIAVARFLTDGQLDTTFNDVGYTFLPFSSVSSNLVSPQTTAIALDRSGNIIVTGYASNTGAGQDNLFVARFLPNGTADSTFGIQGSSGITGTMPITQQSTGYTGTVAGSSNGSGGSLGYITLLFNNQLIGYSVVTDSEDRIIIGGTTNNNAAILLRFLPSGALDTSFGTGNVVGQSGPAAGYVVGFQIVPDGPNSIYAITILPNGTIVGTGNNLNNETITFSMNNNGNSTNTNFNYPLGYQIVPIVLNLQRSGMITLQSDGSITIGASGFNGNATVYSIITARYTSTGDIDTTYGNGTGYVETQFDQESEAYGLTYDHQGKLLVTGYLGSYTLLLRYTNNGSLDTTFSPTGYILVDTIPMNQSTTIANRVDGTLVLGSNIDGLNFGSISLLGGGIPLNQTSAIEKYGYNNQLYEEFLYINEYAQYITNVSAQTATITSVNTIFQNYATTYTSIDNFNFIAYLYLNNRALIESQATLIAAYPGSSEQITKFFNALTKRIESLTSQQQ